MIILSGKLRKNLGISLDKWTLLTPIFFWVTRFFSGPVDHNHGSAKVGSTMVSSTMVGSIMIGLTMVGSIMVSSIMVSSIMVSSNMVGSTKEDSNMVGSTVGRLCKGSIY